MSIFSATVSSIFWGILLLVVVVVVHEFGHFLAARIVGCRVTEFFVGFPCRFKIARKSKKRGTEFGITPVLFGGYNRVCGMEPVNDEHSKRVFAYVLRHGTVDVDDVVRECDMTEEDALNALTVLAEWSAIEPKEEEHDDKKSKRASEPRIFQTVDRDSAFLTRYDRGNTLALDKTVAYPAGSIQPCDDADACYEAECAHVYRGKGLFARIFVLIMGVFVNVFVSAVLILGILMFRGAFVADNSNVVAKVTAQSCAAKAGLQKGDILVNINGKDTTSWHEVTAQLDAAIKKGTPFTVVYERSGVRGEVVAHPPDGALQFGVHNSGHWVPLGFGEAVQTLHSCVMRVLEVYGKLINPLHTAEALGQASSVVGISVAASKMAAAGFFSFIELIAFVSLSLGIMNLLPLLPLDGGRVIIEAVQFIFRREISAKVLNRITLVGFVLLCAVVVIVLRADIFRLAVGQFS